MSYIDDIYTMDDIFSMEDCIGKQTGIDIHNVSYWDSSSTFQKQMSQVLQLPIQSLPWDYYYTYSISKEDRIQVLKNIGIPLEYLNNTMGLLLQSSTIAIVNMINLLKHFEKRKLCILQPSYFSVGECCKMLSLNYAYENIIFSGNDIEIPIDRIINGGYDCVWITSPVFCTGKYYNQAQQEEICRLKEAGLTLVFDESLALPGKELLRSIPIDPQTFAIYSPHKAIAINGLKFSVLICDVCYEDFLEQWIDVFSGALSSSNRDAVFHYLSHNYSAECLPKYLAYIENTKNAITELLKQFPSITMLPDTYGHYITVFTGIRIKDKEELLDMMKSLVRCSMASFIPGTLNGFSEKIGLCFRINLTGDIISLTDGVGRILTVLSNRSMGSGNSN